MISARLFISVKTSEKTADTDSDKISVTKYFQIYKQAVGSLL
jgi:hypothetical protein